MPPFLVCIHDATPAFERETRTLLRDLAPLVGTRLALGVVPDWHGGWPLAEHPDYCRRIRGSADELLLHGYFHRRRRGRGPATLLTGGSDEMSGLDGDETRRTIERGQRVFTEMFGEPARGFVAPAWQRGNVGDEEACALGLEHVLGFFSLRSQGGRSVPLATWTWDCGRWRWLGHVGHAVGWLLQRSGDRVPALAIHPTDVARGYWPGILRLTEGLLGAGYEPVTVAGLLEAAC
jgi:peptidoglycan/xylan/chitin deacetylase (PgdA/CDA1 family)